ncbi:putative membrane protein AbrB (regulator of aidB expression) [Enterococcus sp. PF1-24]|uniref:hypothetical protein n=1 Tax=unclassified Enterococcus TaxID=2608891 RepID=UPI0024750D4C|nr:MULTISPECIES: hypothetical protein [unclassified Enterococcus]MDH6363301.1 putative membrane protein AbrB (regulator of aidB expression) [Enterococcus sp. PFB1-1]MDH6400398.1 putative membrane protein AbrB (regulator of aidB expression) [Enterococcus sp. PF1-24]
MKQYHNDEEFKQQLKKRIRLYLLICLLGGILWLSIFLASEVLKIEMPAHATDFSFGTAGGMVGAGLALALKTYRISKNPKLLRKQRIQTNDERNHEIASKAVRMAGFCQFLAIYAMALIGPYINQMLSYVASGLIGIYMISYCIFYFIYNRKL